MRRPAASTHGASADLDTALATMSAEELRELVRELLDRLEGRAHASAVDALVARAARSGSGWGPAPVGEAEVGEVLAFVTAAKRAGFADPARVDEHLRRGTSAFLRKDYATAHTILGALLPPIADGDIDLAQDELVDEVLGADVTQCAAQFVVSAYMLTPSTERADAVRAALDDVRGLAGFWEPLRELERAAIEPLPDLAEFLPRWRDLVSSRRAAGPSSDWDTDEDRWLREAVQRIGGVAGLAKVARTTRRAADLRAWCSGLVAAGDWSAALAAFDEAATLVSGSGSDGARGELLDGAALAAMRLGRRKDLPGRLEAAWRARPTLLRLRRWLGTSADATTLARRVATALDACPKEAVRQRAMLLVLARDLAAAAALLANAPGLGWSNPDHPGALLFPSFARLLGGDARAERLSRHTMTEELEAGADEGDAPRLAAPDVEQLRALAGIGVIADEATRAAVLAAMKTAAERRVAGATEQKRRGQYPHAAALVAVCVACDGSNEAVQWAEAIASRYRRFSALRTELDRAGVKS